MNERLGEINKNKFGTEMKIIAYRKSDDIDIQFLDEHGYIFEHQTYSNFKSGGIKNPYDRNICGIGYMGVGKYHCKYSNGIHTMEYQNWIAMIRRCYDERRKKTYSSYYGTCEVCSEWHNFQVFGTWYEQNFYQVGNERMHIDKDILYPGNKIYSPDTCILVPQRINLLFMNKQNKRGLPNGISQKSNGSYSVKYAGVDYGTRKTLEDAFELYSEKKKESIINAANDYKEIIPYRLYEALLSYEVRIDVDRNYVA